MPCSPPLDVILPIYNAGPYLADAVASIARQTFTDFRCFLCDATTDGSSDFLDDFVRRDPRFVLVRQAKSSLSEALQEALLLTEAPLVARMDADDIALPHRFAVQVGIMEQRPDLLALGSAIRYLDEHGRPGRVARMPQAAAIRNELLWGCPLSHPTAIFRRREVIEAGGYRSFFICAEDYDLWLRLSRKGALDNCPDVLLHYRLHGGNSVVTLALENRRFTLAAQAAHILALGTSEDPLETGRAASCEDLINLLPPRDKILVRGRVLACCAHHVGDAQEDPQGAQWLEELKALPRSAEVRRILASYHMRLVKRYATAQPGKAAKHFALSCAADPGTAAAFCRKLLPRRLRQG